MSRTIGKERSGQPTSQLEALWEDLLSCQSRRVKSAYAQLNDTQKQAVLTHLQHMVSEPGWQPEQRRSAQAALEALQEQAQ